MSWCQPGASCERVPNASFTPAGICTFLEIVAGIPPYLPGDNPADAKKKQLPGWTWADYKVTLA